MPEFIDGLSEVEGKGTVRVRLGDAQLEIAREAAAALGLRPGLPVTPELHAQLLAAAGRRLAAAQVLSWLRGRPRTAGEVRQYLRRHAHPEAVIGAVVDELQHRGLVDDARYAEWYVEARQAHRQTGAGRLVSELCARGVPRELAEAAARRGVGDREQELALAQAAAAPRLAAARRLGRERGMRRLARFLAQRGFSDETVRTVCLRAFAGGAPSQAGNSERPGAAPSPDAEEP
jgi:regulatory protein